MKKEHSPKEVLRKLKQIRKPGSHLKWLTCSHCKYEWRLRGKKPPKCPNCRRDLNPDAQVNVSEYKKKRAKLPELLSERRFTPSLMKQLVDMKLYKYLGVPVGMAKLTAARELQRKANLDLADRFLKCDLKQGQFVEAFGFNSRAALYFRLEKGFKVMAECGRFVLTERGRQKIAEQKIRQNIALQAAIKAP